MFFCCGLTLQEGSNIGQQLKACVSTGVVLAAAYMLGLFVTCPSPAAHDVEGYDCLRYSVKRTYSAVVWFGLHVVQLMLMLRKLRMYLQLGAGRVQVWKAF
jgi:hypothetical protein